MLMMSIDVADIDVNYDRPICLRDGREMTEEEMQIRYY